MSAYCALARLQGVCYTNSDRSRRRGRQVGGSEAGIRQASSSFTGATGDHVPSVGHRRVLDLRRWAIDGVYEEGGEVERRDSSVLRIVLMRHADSESASASTTDFERPVTASGAS